jgi:hypothetical protein
MDKERGIVLRRFKKIYVNGLENFNLLKDPRFSINLMIKLKLNHQLSSSENTPEYK